MRGASAGEDGDARVLDEWLQCCAQRRPRWGNAAPTPSGVHPRRAGVARGEPSPPIRSARGKGRRRELARRREPPCASAGRPVPATTACRCRGCGARAASRSSQRQIQVVARVGPVKLSRSNQRGCAGRGRRARWRSVRNTPPVPATGAGSTCPSPRAGHRGRGAGRGRLDLRRAGFERRGRNCDMIERQHGKPSVGLRRPGLTRGGGRKRAVRWSRVALRAQGRFRF
jgi:hypothetical protein